MYIDTHCHLTDEKLQNDLNKIILDAKNNEVRKIITLGININDSINAIKLTEKYSEVYSCVGVYPHEEINEPIDKLYEKLTGLVKSSNKVVGIGECGIDTPKGLVLTPLSRQKELLEMHIQLALENSLPIVIHNRDSDTHVLEILSKYKNKGLTGVIHSFVSNWEYAKEILDLGFYLSFNAIITYPSGKSIWDVISRMPITKMLAETDAPYLSPQGYRNKLNEPKYVRITTKTLSDIRKMDLEKLKEVLEKNSYNLFPKIELI